MKTNKKMILWKDQQNWQIFKEDNQEKKGKNTLPTIKIKYLIHLDEMYTFLERHKLLNWRKTKSVLI